jgi:hypothetical protein
MFMKTNLENNITINTKIIFNKTSRLYSLLIFNNYYIITQYLRLHPDKIFSKHPSTLWTNLYTRKTIHIHLILFTSTSCKIKFTGKGYKITKYNTKTNTNTTHQLIDFKFNRSHLTTLLITGLLLKKIKKNKILLIFNRYQTTPNIKNNLLKKIRYANIFTKRGLKLTRTVIYKKTGKKSMK